VIRRPQRIKPQLSHAMFSIIDFFPTFAKLAGGNVPDDRPSDGILLLGDNDADVANIC